MSEPDYLSRTRSAWGKMSEDFFEPGRRAWSQSEWTWGIWNILESDIHALGDLSQFQGMKTIELGCGTGYISAWLARLGAEPVGIDPTPEQLANAWLFQQEFGIEFPLIEAYAENLPFEAESFDFAISEYGAAIWSDPYLWLPEAARVLKPGGRLVFLRNGILTALCTPNGNTIATPTMVRDYFGLNRIEWNPTEPEEFLLAYGPLIRLMRECGFDIENLIELQSPKDMKVRYEYIDSDWAHRWPSEEIWCVRKR
jgi:SAM-dependent methyltransferase